MTVVRVGEPLIGGPYYALNPDLEQTSNAAFADLFTACDVGRGDGAARKRTLEAEGTRCQADRPSSPVQQLMRRIPSSVAVAVRRVRPRHAAQSSRPASMSMFIPSSLADRAMKTAIDDMVTKDTAYNAQQSQHFGLLST